MFTPPCALRLGDQVVLEKTIGSKVGPNWIRRSWPAILLTGAGSGTLAEVRQIMALLGRWFLVQAGMWTVSGSIQIGGKSFYPVAG